MKSQADCDSFFDCWIYNLANMKQMKEISFKDRDAIFGRLEELASRGNMSKEERAQYDYEWKIYNDYLNTFNSAEKKAAEKGRAEGLAEGRAEGLEEGRAEGRAEEKLEIAKNMKADGQPLDLIAKFTGLTIEEIEKL
jgi:predicted transposase/invertase (TIGR01784 family)